MKVHTEWIKFVNLPVIVNYVANKLDPPQWAHKFHVISSGM